MLLVNKTKKKLKNFNFIVSLYSIYKSLSYFFCFKPVLFLKQYFWFFSKMRELKKHPENYVFGKFEYYPCLFDNLSSTPLEPTYFFQDTWAAKHIFELKPEHHYDVGSSAKTMGIISQYIPVTMIDIRPIELEINNFFFKKGSILNMPYEDNSLEIISSLCVVEHIGLGRYGDDIDSYGSEKAVKELKRVLKIGGRILFSVPVDDDNKIYFNAHRAFTRNYILELFSGFKIIDEKYHYLDKMYDEYDPCKGFGTGLFYLEKLI